MERKIIFFQINKNYVSNSGYVCSNECKFYNREEGKNATNAIEKVMKLKTLCVDRVTPHLFLLWLAGLQQL